MTRARGYHRTSRYFTLESEPRFSARPVPMPATAAGAARRTPRGVPTVSKTSPLNSSSSIGYRTGPRARSRARRTAIESSSGRLPNSGVVGVERVGAVLDAEGLDEDGLDVVERASWRGHASLSSARMGRATRAPRRAPGGRGRRSGWRSARRRRPGRRRRGRRSRRAGSATLSAEQVERRAQAADDGDRLGRVRIAARLPIATG